MLDESGADDDALRSSYDSVADAYLGRFGDELRHKPLDRALLAVLAAGLARESVVGDVGCGPGHIAAHLQGLGLRPVGVDLSPRMIELAQESHPGIDFAVGSMLELPADDDSWAGIVAFYSVIHLAPDELPTAFAEFHRVLRPGGPLLISYHVGDEVRHADELLGQAVSLDFHFFQAAQLTGLLEAAGFAVEMTLEREPYLAVEGATRRGYVMGRATAPTG